MKNITKLIIFYYLFSTNINSYAEGGSGLLGPVDKDKLRDGDLNIEDIPNILKYLIDIFLGLAGTIAVLFVIIGAYKLLFGSLKSDHTKGRETIIMAISGFAIAALAWFIIKFIFNNFG